MRQYHAPLKAPLSICLWLTDKCNLACKYCYAAPFSGRVMETGRLYSLLDELVECQVFGIVFAGGEPFLHPEIFGLIESVLNRGIQLGVLSNGLILGEHAQNRLARIVSGKKFILQVSLDSIDPLINDQTRGHGAMVVRNIKGLARLGIPLQLACVLTTRNVDQAHLLIQEFYPAIKRYHFLNVQRTKMSLQNADLLLRQEQAYEFWINLDAYSRQFPPDLFLPSLRIMLRTFQREHDERTRKFHSLATFTCSSCSVGLTHVNVDADFNVLGCDIAKDWTRMGNIGQSSFSQVWNSLTAHQVRRSPIPPCYLNTSPEGESLQSWLKPEYSNCVAIRG